MTLLQPRIYKRRMFVLLILLPLVTSFGAKKYVSPTGSDSNDGSFGTPYLTIPKAVTNVAAGDTIYLRGGVHNYSAKITIGKSGSAGLYFKLWAYPGEKPIIDFSAIGGTSSDGFSLNQSYWHFRGIEIRKAPHNGIKITNGDWNIIENCSFHDCGNTGFHIGSSSSSPPYPSNNLIVNCDAYFNYDPPIGGNADGFGVKWNVGSGNVFKGCRSYNNSDDGFDLWMCLGTITIDSCFAFRNGVDSWHSGSFNGNGNGFKLGGNYVATPNIVRNCVAFDNAIVGSSGAGRGFDENNNVAGQTLFNCTSFRNMGNNYQFSNTVTSGQHLIENCISYVGVVNITSGTVDHNSWQGFTVTDADFQSLDTALARAPRSADGGLPNNALFRLSGGSSLIDAGVNVGLPYKGSAPDIGAYETNGSTTTFTLTTVATNGTVAKNPSQAAYDSASIVQLTATPATGYHFTSWSGDLTGSTNPASVTMNANKNITANFAINTYTITISASNGSVSKSPNQTVYDSASVVQLTAIPATGYHFTSWGGDLTGSTNPANVTMNANKNLTANFAINTYSLTINATNGTVTKNPNQTTYDSASVAQLTATPISGYHFTSWSGDLSGSTNPANVTMNANKNITANFAINTYSLTINATNGTVTKNPNQTTYDSSSVVQLTTTPATGYHFVSWSGDLTGSTNPATITMNANKNITANFVINTYSLTISATNGSVTKTPNQTSYDSASVVQLMAAPVIGYHFVSWSGDLTSSTNPATVTMNANKNITANFAINTYSLTISAINGTVTKNPDQTVYDSASIVQLTAVPASGYSFAFWSGDVTGSTNPVNVTMNAIKNVTANFTSGAMYVPVNVAQGWNLVSVPLLQSTYDADIIFYDKFGDMFGYSGGSYAPTPILSVGKGYWVYYTSARNISIVGASQSPITISLTQGWNLIGSSGISVATSALTTSPAGQIFGDLFGYNTSSGGYVTALSLGPGGGFWVYVMADCILTIP